mmetsp:Transcript_3509/g.2546  ORF Transcript_3509/g.2546 Transcript_3509/m.2546 type:complete len:93 (-) Transcript_3509:189-467(-)
MSKKLEKDRIEANKKKMVVEEEKRVVDEKAEIVNAQYSIAMKELNDVLPILKEAEAALDTLNTQDIADMKVVNSPVPPVLATMKAIYMLLMK